MKIKAGELFIAVEAIGRMRNDKMPLRAASWLVLLNKRLAPSHEIILEKRNEIIRKYCEEGKNKVAQEKMADYLKEVEPFLKEEVEVDAVKVGMSIFENVSISADSLMALEHFLDDAA